MAGIFPSRLKPFKNWVARELVYLPDQAHLRKTNIG
jgi:hypothetical protein